MPIEPEYTHLQLRAAERDLEAEYVRRFGFMPEFPMCPPMHRCLLLIDALETGARLSFPRSLPGGIRVDHFSAPEHRLTRVPNAAQLLRTAVESAVPIDPNAPKPVLRTIME